jgi:phage FluMu protein Com
MAAVILSLISLLTRNNLLILIAYIPLAYALLRILSRNIEKRTKENYTYCEIVRNIKVKFKNLLLILIGTKTHKYYRCGKCRQLIRVPRDKGKIRITCPKCKAEFVRRT